MSEEKYDRFISDAVRHVMKTHGLVPEELEDARTPITPKVEETIASKTLVESYVATAKSFKQVTEFISQKTKDAHMELYLGNVSAVNDVSGMLDSANADEANSRHADFRSLKLDETFNLNAVWLHELFFANCFDPNSEVYMDSIAFMRLQRDFGTFDAWQKDFIGCAKACGEGWAVCGYNMFLKRYVNTIISHHSADVPMGIYPVIVLDCWSHAYFRDYLADKNSYITAMMRELNWVTIEERCNKVEKIAEAIK
jgi:Fe-Mn family superoxide dismutase